MQACLGSWSTLGDSYVYSVIEFGLYVNWVSSDPSPTPCTLVPVASVHERRLLKAAIASGHLKRVDPADVKCVSETFAIPKKHGPGEETHRLIINLKNVNAWILTEYFQLPSLQKILPYLRRGLWGVVIDLKAAYTHMPLSPEVKPFMTVHLDGVFYQFQALMFGLNCAPREWQRLMAPIINKVRALGALVWVYLDDFLLLAPDERRCLEWGQVLVNLLWSLGLEVAATKGALTPTQHLIYLGFHLNFDSGTVTVPDPKLRSVVHILRQLLGKDKPTARFLSSVLGKVRSLSFAVPHVRILTDILVKHLAVVQRRGWESAATVPQQVLDQVALAISELQEWRGRKFDLRLPNEQTFYTDASGGGGGVTLNEQGLAGGDTAWGWFSQEQMSFHINRKEFLAGLLALRSFAPRNCNVQLYTDSMAFYWYIKHWGGRSPRLNKVIRELHDYCVQHEVVIHPHYVPTQLNPADAWSRISIDQANSLAETTLDETTLQEILSHYKSKIVPLWDWRGTELSAVARPLPQMRVPSGTPQIAGKQLREEFPQIQFQTLPQIQLRQNLMSANLREISPGWIFPPTSMIPDLIQMFRTQSHWEVLMVVPRRIRAPWWASLLRFAAQPPLTLIKPRLVTLMGQAYPLTEPHVCVHACSASIVTGERPQKKRKFC